MIDLAQYRSPKNDCSVYYWIPIQHLEEVRKRLGGKYFRYVYRGPRLNLLKSFTPKRWARAFSVYEKSA